MEHKVQVLRFIAENKPKPNLTTPQRLNKFHRMAVGLLFIGSMKHELLKTSNSCCCCGRILTKQIPMDSPLNALRVLLWTQVDWMMSLAAN